MTQTRSHRISPARSARSVERDVYERLSQRIEEFAEREGHYSNAEKIRLMREAAFADLVGFKHKPIPKWNG
jgi:hypothetical protein